MTAGDPFHTAKPEVPEYLFAMGDPFAFAGARLKRFEFWPKDEMLPPYSNRYSPAPRLVRYWIVVDHKMKRAGFWNDYSELEIRDFVRRLEQSDEFGERQDWKWNYERVLESRVKS